ncbi:MAG TPA: hypothetical protein VFK69_07910, partial [Candidatus Eisenbacteria bacterium]|nr:hypothetical protein [Candidatus Eisenbacteria bacterium]
MPSSAPVDRAFATLERALLRRRLTALDRLLALELALIGALVAGFVYWQTRLPLDHVARNVGPWAAAGLAAVTLLALALLGGAAAGSRHHAQLTRGAPGPAWLAL